MTISKSKIDRLGDRLKGNQATKDDLRLLDEFRRSFSPAYESVITTITEQLKLQPTGRPAKSTTSISDKLNRESIRLTQIQDIAGCRLIVSDLPEQGRVVSELLRVFPSAKVHDRRASPSHGYRAVHVIVDLKGKLIEIQVRTSLQHLWAEMSEKASDIVDPGIKYGSANEEVPSLLARLAEISELIKTVEIMEGVLAVLDPSVVADSEMVDNVNNGVREIRARLHQIMIRTVEVINSSKQEGKNDIFD